MGDGDGETLGFAFATRVGVGRGRLVRNAGEVMSGWGSGVGLAMESDSDEGVGAATAAFFKSACSMAARSRSPGVEARVAPGFPADGGRGLGRVATEL